MDLYKGIEPIEILSAQQYKTYLFLIDQLNQMGYMEAVRMCNDKLLMIEVYETMKQFPGSCTNLFNDKLKSMLFLHNNDLKYWEEIGTAV